MAYALWRFTATKKQITAYHLYEDCGLLLRRKAEVVEVSDEDIRERRLTECQSCFRRSLREQASSTHKVCAHCRAEKPLDEFYRSNKNGRDGRGSYCKPCCRERFREWKARTPEQKDDLKTLRARKRQHRASRLKAYGLTLEDYEKRVLKQNGRCAACGDEPGVKGLQVDHDHQFTTVVAVRDLLCTSCNMALGLLKDDIDRIQLLHDYMKKWEEALHWTPWPFPEEDFYVYEESN